MRTAWLLIVMPRSRSMSIRSRYCARIARASTTPVSCSIRSASVDLPWSMWAMMQKLRISSGGVAAGCSAVRAMGDTAVTSACSVTWVGLLGRHATILPWRAGGAGPPAADRLSGAGVARPSRSSPSAPRPASGRPPRTRADRNRLPLSRSAAASCAPACGSCRTRGPSSRTGRRPVARTRTATSPTASGVTPHRLSAVARVAVPDRSGSATGNQGVVNGPRTVCHAPLVPPRGASPPRRRHTVTGGHPPGARFAQNARARCRRPSSADQAAMPSPATARTAPTRRATRSRSPPTARRRRARRRGRWRC